MNSNNNINTGRITNNVDEFQWFKPNSSVHVEGYKTSAPAFDIPPTPASSYANLHVVLDTVHQSTETITRGVVLPHSHLNTTSVTSFTPSAPIQEAPIQQTGLFNNNKLDDIPSTTFRAVPDYINPEQPGARANDALTSLKSEVAPLVQLDELAERRDRDLPESVDISLVDESFQRYPLWNELQGDIKNKNWNLRSTRPQHNSKWDQVGSDVAKKNWKLHNTKPQHNAQWDRVGSDIQQKNWKLHAPSVGGQWGNQWKLVGSDINKKNWRLKHYQPKSFSNWRKQLDRLEEAERQWRSTRVMSPIWSGRMHQIGNEIILSIAPIGWAQWLSNLKNKIVNKSMDLLDSAKEISSEISDDVAIAMSKPKLVYKYEGLSLPKDDFAEPIDFTFRSRRVPLEIIKLEEAERLDRMTRGIDGVLSGKWYRLGREMIPYFNRFANISDWLSGLKSRAAWRGHNLMDSAMAEFNHLNATKAPKSLAVPRSAIDEFDLVDFTFKSRRCPLDIWQLEDQERAWRLSHPVSPILLGKLHRLGLELKYKFTLRPTLVSTANQITRAASDVVAKAGEVLGNIENFVIEKSKDLMAKAEPAPEFSEEHPLNYFAYTAEPIDFTFKSRRCPKAIIAAEEEERARRISKGMDPVAYSKWNNLLSQPHKTLMPVPATYTSMTKDAVVHAAADIAEKGKGWANYFLGPIAHFAHDKMVATKDSLVGMYDHTSTASITKAEELERVRRMNEKMSPMMMARYGRVQDELLQQVKSV